jgi:hypothetical protein
VYRVLLGNPEERDLSEDRIVDGRLAGGGGLWNGFSWLRIGTVGGVNTALGTFVFWHPEVGWLVSYVVVNKYMHTNTRGRTLARTHNCFL